MATDRGMKAGQKGLPSAIVAVCTNLRRMCSGQRES